MVIWHIFASKSGELKWKKKLVSNKYVICCIGSKFHTIIWLLHMQRDFFQNALCTKFYNKFKPTLGK
jgi:hypothetical protein